MQVPDCSALYMQMGTDYSNMGHSNCSSVIRTQIFWFICYLRDGWGCRRRFLFTCLNTYVSRWSPWFRVMQPISVGRRVKCHLPPNVTCVVWVQDNSHTSWPLSPPRNQTAYLMPSFLSPQYLKGPARDKRFMKAPLAVYWTAKEENTGLLSLTIQYGAVGVSGSKWEHVSPWRRGRWVQALANYFVKQGEEQP